MSFLSLRELYCFFRRAHMGDCGNGRPIQTLMEVAGVMRGNRSGAPPKLHRGQRILHLATTTLVRASQRQPADSHIVFVGFEPNLQRINLFKQIQRKRYSRNIEAQITLQPFSLGNAGEGQAPEPPLDA